MLKRTIAACAATLMLLGICPAGTTATETDKYNDAIRTLGALEIMVGDAGSGAFRPEDPIKRSEFAKVAVHSLGLSELSSSFTENSVFSDVDDTHWAKGYIAIAAKQGIVVGDPGGTFRPDDSISYEEAVTVLVRMAGYEPAAQSRGGYPTGYLAVGQTEGILDKVPPTPGQKVNRATVAQLTYNTLQVPMMEKANMGANADYAVTDKTLLEDRLHVQETRGTLTASEHTALSGTAAGAGFVEIDGVRYATEAGNADALVGHAVRALMRQTDKGNTIFSLFSDSARTKTLTIDAADIEALSASELVYDNGKARVTENLASGAIFLVNGRRAEHAEKPANGSVTLIAADGDAYSVVCITDYVTQLVENVYPTAHKVTTADGETLLLDPANKNLHFTVEDTDGRALSLSELRKNDVLSVAKSADGEICKILVSRLTAEGEVNEVTDTHITIGDTAYPLSPAFSGSALPGEKVLVRLDATGKIAFSDSTSLSGKQYAYLLKADMEKGLSGKLLLSVLKADGRTEILRGADNMRLDGESLSHTATLAALSAPTLLLLTENEEGLVTEITRFTDETASFPQSHENRFVLNAALSDAVYNAAAMKLGSVTIDEKTVFFSIPEGETESDRYAASNYTILTDKTAYDAYVYDMKEDMTAGVVILTSAHSRIAAEAPILVVERVSTAQDDDGRLADKLYGLSEGKSVTHLSAEGVSLSHLSGGDIVQYSTDKAGNITEVRVLLAASAYDTEGKNELSDTVETVYGKVTGRFASSVNVSCALYGTENYKTADATVYLVDSARGSASVTLATAADIMRHEEDGSRLFLRLENKVAREIVIVK